MMKSYDRKLYLKHVFSKINIGIKTAEKHDIKI